MTRDLPPELARQVEDYTGFPWWNGEAYASFVGYPQKIHGLQFAARNAANDLDIIMTELRAQKNYALSDRLRTIARQLERDADDCGRTWRPGQKMTGVVVTEPIKL